MAKYVLMTKLSGSTLSDRRRVGKEWLKAVEEHCPEIEWVAHYALLGPYDFMDIYEAPDTDTAFKVSLLSREKGAVTAESWPMLPYESYVGIADSVES